jgi:hypothetical protein
MNTNAIKKVPTANERNQFHWKNVLSKSIRQMSKKLANDNLQIIFNASSALETDIRVFPNLSELNRKLGLKIAVTEYGNDTNSIKRVIPKESENIKFDYITYLSEECISEVIDYSVNKKIPTYIIEDGLLSYWPNSDCIHFRNGDQYWDMLEQYQPAGIIIYPVSFLDIIMGRSILGIYLLDADNLIIGKLLIEFFDERLAPKGSKKLRVPASLSEI